MWGEDPKQWQTKHLTFFTLTRVRVLFALYGGFQLHIQGLPRVGKEDWYYDLINHGNVPLGFTEEGDVVKLQGLRTPDGPLR